MKEPTDAISNEARAVLNENLADVLQNGPGLRYRSICILAKDTAHGAVLVGGLGGMGVGQMWFPETEYHKRSAGYADAPERTEGAYFNEFTQCWVVPR